MPNTIATERAAFIVALNDRLRPLSDPAEIQNQAVRLLGQWLDADWAFGVDYDDDLTRAIVHSTYTRPGLTSFAGLQPLDSLGPLLGKLKTGHTVAESDLGKTTLAGDPARLKYGSLGVRGFVITPIVKDGRLIAAVGACSRACHDWTELEIALVEETAERTWAAAERARVERAVANELRDTRLLHDLSARLVTEADTQAFFDAILSAAVGITRAVAGTVRVLDPASGMLTIFATHGFDDDLVERMRVIDAGPATSIVRAISTGQRAFVDLDGPDPSEPGGLLSLQYAAGLRFAQSTPLVTRDGRIIGVLTTHSRTRRRPPERELRFLDLLARQAADLIERRRADDALRESQHQLSEELADTRLLQTLSAHLIEEEDSGALYEKIMDAAASIMHSDYSSLQVFHPERGPAGELQLLTSRNLSAEAIRHWEWVKPDACTTCAEALRRNARVIVPDFEQSSFMAGSSDQAMYLAGGVRAGQSTPLISRGGKTVGMISTYWKDPLQPSERDLRLLDIVARQAADLIERTQAVDALRRSEAQLKEADRRKDEFLAVLAHELRNPLAPIRTALELVRLAGSNASMVEEAREIMERQVSHMVRLIDDLLDVSRIASGKIQLRRQPALLSSLINSAIEANLVALNDADIVLDVDLPEKPVSLDVDPTRFVQVLTNVLNNAVKFSHSGGHVSISANHHASNGTAGEAQIVVSDAGLGISADLLPRVFEMFTQDETSSRSRGPGLGIGLALARQLIELHGGSIDAYSAGPGHGSAFTVRVPLPASNDQTPTVLSAPELPKTTRRVVIIDDNVDAANALRRLVQVMGGECRVAYNGESGLGEVLASQPDIVFLDIGMPNMDGYEVCRRIRKTAGSGILVVALTGWGQERNKQDAADAGFDLHLTKPADAVALENILATGHV